MLPRSTCEYLNGAIICGRQIYFVNQIVEYTVLNFQYRFNSDPIFTYLPIFYKKWVIFALLDKSNVQKRIFHVIESCLLG